MQQIFITSNYRSGVMLLTKMLSANSKVNIGSSVINYFRFYYNNKKYYPIKKKYIKVINDVCNRLKKRQKILINKNNCLDFVKKNGISHKNLIQILNFELYKKLNSEIVGEAETNAWRSIPTFLKMFPDSKVIIVLRDPRDILCSFKKLTISKKNNYLISIFNCLDLINNTWKLKAKYKRKIIIVKFHEFKKNKIRLIKNICNQLNINFEKKMLDENSFLDLKGKKWDTKYSYTFKNNLQKKTINRWKKIVLPEDLYLCEIILKKQIKSLGLKLSNKKFTRKNIDDADKKISASNLILESYKHWKKTGQGNDKFPLNPLDPKTWRDHKR